MRNQIAFDIDISLLERALKSCEPAEKASVKLSKKSTTAYLSFEIIVQSVPMMTIIQDVPIALLSGEDVENFHEPSVQTPAVQLSAPPLKSVFSIVERLKSLDCKILLRANMMGELSLGVETDLVFLNNVWTDLSPPDALRVQNEDKGQHGEANIDAGILSRLTSSHFLRPSSTFCCIGDHSSGKLLIWHMILGEDSLTYYLPVLETS
mmetsp:Transcript_78425/g.210954  ORF Transcript_78425/g.210954 Transcript_78425/m.210954 type:complete len:208 (+) Transcript_78425:83-706(+)